jgi:DNA-binding response OmpR family regulator
MQEATSEPRRLTVLVYASNAQTTDRVVRALGEHPSPAISIDVITVDTDRLAMARLDAGGIDLAILDGEAAPSGGMGLARQIKDEIDVPPPIVLLVARRDDAWLASWSRAEAVVSHPVDAVTLASAVTSLIEGSAANGATEPAAAH